MAWLFPDLVDIYILLVYIAIALCSTIFWLLLAGVGVLIYKIVRCLYVSVR